MFNQVILALRKDFARAAGGNPTVARMGMSNGYKVMAVYYSLAETSNAQHLEAVLRDQGVKIITPLSTEDGIAVILFSVNSTPEQFTPEQDAENAINLVADSWHKEAGGNYAPEIVPLGPGPAGNMLLAVGYGSHNEGPEIERLIGIEQAARHYGYIIRRAASILPGGWASLLIYEFM